MDLSAGTSRSLLAAAQLATALVAALARAQPQPPPRQAPEAAALPDRPNPEARYLVLATHGWNSRAAVWATPMIAAMGNTIPMVDRPQWHLVAYDWANAARTVRPNAAVGAARAIGAQLAAQVAAPFPGGYDRIHVLGHSAGSFLINAIPGAIQDNRPVQITFFDAYETAGGANSNLGRRAALFSETFAEQYVDNRELVTPLSSSHTDETLRFVCNHDITALDDRGLQGFTNFHAWPYEFYHRTVVMPAGADATAASGWGFGRAIALSPALLAPSHATDCARNTRTIHQPPSPMAQELAAADSIQFEAPIDLTQHIASPTGTVELLEPTRVRLTTGPGSEPVWITVLATNQAVATYLAFDWEFVPPDAEGWLAAYIDVDRDDVLDDRDLYFQEGEPYLPAGPHLAELVPLQQDSSYAVLELPSGTTVVGFRIDPMTADQSEAILANIRFGAKASALDASLRDHPEPLKIVFLSPNPTSGPSQIRFTNPARGPVRVAIYDSRGVRIRTLLDAVLAPGGRTVHWDGRAEDGKQVANGVYFVQLQTRNQTLNSKLVVLR